MDQRRAWVNLVATNADMALWRVMDDAAIALAAFLGPSLTNAMIAIGIAALPTFLRLARGTVLVLKAEEYIEAAHALGCSHVRIAARHILPNMLPPLFIQSSITVAAAIIAEAKPVVPGAWPAARRHRPGAVC